MCNNYVTIIINSFLHKYLVLNLYFNQMLLNFNIWMKINFYLFVSQVNNPEGHAHKEIFLRISADIIQTPFYGRKTFSNDVAQQWGRGGRSHFCCLKLLATQPFAPVKGVRGCCIFWTVNGCCVHHIHWLKYAFMTYFNFFALFWNQKGGNESKWITSVIVS